MVESVKAASDVYAPVAGVVTAVNEALHKHPEFISEDPYGKGWLIKLKPDDPAALNRLLKSCDYESLVSSEE